MSCCRRTIIVRPIYMAIGMPVNNLARSKGCTLHIAVQLVTPLCFGITTIGVNFLQILGGLMAPFFLLPSSPLPSPPLPLEVGPPNPAMELGERCKLPQRDVGRSPSRNRIWCILALKSVIWWQQF